MEVQRDTTSKRFLILTNYVFNALLDITINFFKESHQIKEIYKYSQLYGFGNYDPDKPNLKKDFQTIAHQYVNGKYLYNKFRECTSGKPIIKINTDYQYILFKYLGFKDVYEFLKNTDLPQNQKNEQIKLLDKNISSQDYYYISYYLGEDRQMSKGQIIIHNEWKTAEITYTYKEENNITSTHNFFGNIIQSENFVHFNTKLFVGNKKIEGARLIFFVGKSSPNERYFLIGTYAGFDKYGRAIAGKMILQKVISKSQMELNASNSDFSPLISQELIGKRIIVESNIKKNPLSFSQKSPYSKVLLDITGNYTFSFLIGKEKHTLNAQIQPKHYNIISLTNSIILEESQISLLSRGRVLNLDFIISGMFKLQKVSIYISTHFFNQSKMKIKGNFAGIDINNNVVYGCSLLDLI